MLIKQNLNADTDVDKQYTTVLCIISDF